MNPENKTANPEEQLNLYLESVMKAAEDPVEASKAEDKILGTYLGRLIFGGKKIDQLDLRELIEARVKLEQSTSGPGAENNISEDGVLTTISDKEFRIVNEMVKKQIENKISQ